MVRINEINKLAQSFYDRIVSAQQNQSEQYSNAIVQKMQNLANGCILATNHLLSNPKYKRSAGLLVLKDKMPQILSMLSSFSFKDDNSFYDDLKAVFEAISFYTTPANSGTGYDPITAIRDAGYTAPAYYVNSLFQLFNKLNQYRPNTQDPLNNSIRQQGK